MPAGYVSQSILKHRWPEGVCGTCPSEKGRMRSSIGSREIRTSHVIREIKSFPAAKKPRNGDSGFRCLTEGDTLAGTEVAPSVT